MITRNEKTTAHEKTGCDVEMASSFVHLTLLFLVLSEDSPESKFILISAHRMLNFFLEIT